MQSPRLAALLIAAALLAGCASVNETRSILSEVVGTANQWQVAVAEEKFDQALKFVSEEFASPTWPNKAALNEYFATARERGYFSDSAIQNDPFDVTVESDTAKIYPIAIRGNLGVAVFSLALKKEDTGWKITSAEMELY